MAVIINMDMPKNCAECPIFYDCMECSITTTQADFEQMNSERLSDCPLKSVDEMIKEIKIKMWNWRGNQSTQIDKIAMEKILNEVIDKYTDKENK